MPFLGDDEESALTTLPGDVSRESLTEPFFAEMLVGEEVSLDRANGLRVEYFRVREVCLDVEEGVNR